MYLIESLIQRVDASVGQIARLEKEHKLSEDEGRQVIGQAGVFAAFLTDIQAKGVAFLGEDGVEMLQSITEWCDAIEAA